MRYLDILHEEASLHNLPNDAGLDAFQKLDILLHNFTTGPDMVVPDSTAGHRYVRPTNSHANIWENLF